MTTPDLPNNVQVGEQGHVSHHNIIHNYIENDAPAKYARLPVVGLDLRDYASLRAAYDALPATGGVIRVPVGRFLSGFWSTTDYLSKPNVSIIGDRMPYPSANCDRLEGGSVIEGRFIGFADGLHVENVGFDIGKFVTDTYYGGNDTHVADHPDGGGWDSFVTFQPNQATPLPQRRGCKFFNLIGLCRDSQSFGHAVLLEAMDDMQADNIIGVGAIQCTVVKSSNSRIGKIAGWAGGNNGVIFKTDSYAPCVGLTVDTVEYLKTPPNTTPWFTPASSNAGLRLNPATGGMAKIQIGTLRSEGAVAGLQIDGQPQHTVADVQIGSVVIEGPTIVGISHLNCRALRIDIGSLIANNCNTGVDWAPVVPGDANAQALSIGSVMFTNVGRAFALRAFARVRVDRLELNNVDNAYFIEDTARLLVGVEALFSAVTTKFERVPPALAAGWGDLPGNPSFLVKLDNYGVALSGIVSASEGVTSTIASLPLYLRPGDIKRQLAYHVIANQPRVTMIATAPSIGVNMAELGPAPVAGDYVSLEGVDWDLL